MTDHWPPITALCPTYGRFEALRDAVACFLLQDYAGDKRLIIANDSEVPLILSESLTSTAIQELPEHNIHVGNVRPRYPTLGHKRHALLMAAHRGLVAHWDDDDLYMPWHLTQCVEALRAHPGALCAKPKAAWWALGPRAHFRAVKGPCHNVFEGQMVFDRTGALVLGDYPPRVSGQARALLKKFRKAGELHTWNPEPADISYVYRWDDGLHHISGMGNNAKSHDAFGDRNRDFGDGEPLIPADDPIEWARERLAGPFDQLCRLLEPGQDPSQVRRIRARLDRALCGTARTEADRPKEALI